MKGETRYSRVFVASMWCFLLAAAAGIALRFFWAGALPLGGVDPSNLRRAHSHLMLFAWVTPALAALIAAFAPWSRRVGFALWAMLVLGLLSFPSFLIWGYGVARIGDARIPISIIVSTLSMVAWYVFAWAWISIRSTVAERVSPLAMLAWDGSIALLILGSLGAWARGAFMGMGVESRLMQDGAVEFFLTSYVDGFLLLGVVGLLAARYESSDTLRNRIAMGVLILATPLEFLAFLPVDLVPSNVRGVSAIAVAGAGLATLVLAHAFRHHWSGVFLGILGAGKLLLIHPALASDVLSLGLRIPYLHILLLGLVTLVLVDEARFRWPFAVGPSPMNTAVIISLVALLPTTGLWPDSLPRQTGLYLTAAASILPALAILWSLWSARAGIGAPKGEWWLKRRKPLCPH